MPIAYDREGRPVTLLNMAQKFYNVNEIRLRSRWVTEQNGRSIPKPYCVTDILLEGQTSTFKITVYKSNGIIIDDAMQYTGAVSDDEETGTQALIIRRFPLAEKTEETAEGVSL